MAELPATPAAPEEAPGATLVTVFIPTFNGERYLRETLTAILDQRLPPDLALEVLVIDSGSTDRTLAILEEFAGAVRLHRIPNEEFSHGGTRDLAARLAHGAYVVYLTQDATPAHDRWLVKMIEPFALSPRVGCVYGGQRPRADAAVSIRREVTEAFAGRRAEIVVSVPRSLVDDVPEQAPDSFFSDVNSAARRDLLVGDVPFRHVRYAEDQALALDMQNAGHLKAYAFDAYVWHSNEFTAGEFHHRKFDEYVGRARSTGTALHDSVASLLLGWVKPTVRDWLFLAREPTPWRARLRGLLDAPRYNGAAKAARYRASQMLTADDAGTPEAPRSTPRDGDRSPL